ncbi:DUF5913 domain-containing protein, partial [Vibrio parahaemolyticus]|nr:DUF5913 domain-containing protein [Vibrio parahaemolyticus]
INKLKEQHGDIFKPNEMTLVEQKILKTENRARSKSSQGVKLEGVDNIKIKFAKCCNPLPGDDIIGFITKGRGVSIHRTDCPNLKTILDQKERLINVYWDTEKASSYQAEIKVKAHDREGLLADITSKLNELDAGLLSLNAKKSKDKTVSIKIVLEIKNKDELIELIRKLK